MPLILCATAASAAVEFNRDIRPILSDRCFTCHGPDAGNRRTALRFDVESAARAAIVAGDPEKSELYRRVSSTDPARRMPPAYLGHDALPVRDVNLFREWIQQGAPWGKHWSFVAPRRPEPPEVKTQNWAHNPIDRFILARLEREGLAPSPEAGRAILLRRLALDLTGLPPTPEEAAAFLHDGSPDAYEKLVDRLLASPRHAERMAMRWLEAARYADTNGYQSDGVRSMWRWRDWVLDAFRHNMPFDQFTIEQIAGDLLPNATLQQKIATGFHRNHRTNAEGGIVEEEFRVEYVADRVETTSTVWLGLTTGCARCHDHKYDPIRQKDFYQLFAFFNNVPERGLVYNFGNEEPYLKAPTEPQTAQLQDLDRKVSVTRSKYEALAPKLTAAQQAWHMSLRNAKPLAWAVPSAWRFELKDDDTQFDGKRAFDGGDVANFNFEDPFTLAAWITPEAPDGTIASRIEDYWEGEGYGLYLKDGKLRLQITRRFTDISLRLETEEPIPLNVRQHIVVTVDGSRKGAGVKIYVNGESRKIRVLFDELTYPFGPKVHFQIGAGGGLRFKGKIEDVRVYKTPLSPAEAATVPLSDTMNELASIDASKRLQAQSDLLAFCFLDQFAPREIKDARAEMLAAQKERDDFYKSIPTVMVMQESVKPRPAFVLKRGAYDAPGEKVEPAVPGFLPQLRPEWPANRLGLAQWLVDPANPLTARTVMNRLWQMYFGVGLVKTLEDFGSQGEWPVNPDLLDWLATEFIASGWNLKAMHKTIVMSAAYWQLSKVTPELLQKDPENRLLARGPRIRLGADVIRDQALAVSGLLVERFGGPSVKPYQPPGLWQELTGGKGYDVGKGPDLYRRSLYTYWKRTIAPPSMVTFDSPTRETCSVRETRTNTPLQALHLMNDVAYVEAARKLAERMMAGGDTAAERVKFGFQLALVRQPRTEESKVLLDTLEKFRAFYAEHKDAAAAILKQGESTRDYKLDAAELASYTGVASLIFNLDEMVTKE